MYTALDHTFVVCAYRENPYIGETIASLQAQTVETNIILSTSTPNDYLREVCLKYSVPMVVNPKPNLAGDDWNYGYDSAQTSLVTIAHQDDYYDPTFVECMVETLNTYGDDEVLIGFSGYFEIREGHRVDSNTLLRIKRILSLPLAFRMINGSKFIRKRILGFGDPICCPAVTLVKSKLGPSPFDTTYKNSCDYKTWVDLAGKEGRFVYIRKPLMGHRIYAESATSLNLGENIRRGEDLEIMSLLWPRPIVALVNNFYALSERSNAL